MGACSRAPASTGTVRVWDPACGRLLFTFEGHTAATWSVALSTHGELAASASVDMTVRLWNTTRGQAASNARRPHGGRWSVALSGDGRLVASASFDGTIRLWESASGQVLTTLHGHTRRGA